jgi:hypothetical protein
MTTAVSETEQTSRIEFQTSDSEEAIEYLRRVYGAELQVGGTHDAGQLFAHSRLGAGSFAIDDVRLPLDLRARQDPLGALVIIELAAGTMERDCAGVSERFLAGDIFIDAEPSLPASVRMLDTVVRPVMLDLAVLARSPPPPPPAPPAPYA